MGGDTDSKDEAANKSREHREDNVPPGEDNGAPKIGFLPFLKNVLLAGVFGTGIWVVGEHLKGLGYNGGANVANFLATVIFVSVLPFEVVKHWQRPILVWVLWSVVFVGPTVFVFFILKPEPRAVPSFRFSLFESGKPPMELELTNDFLAIKDWETPHPRPPIGCILLPVKSTNNATVDFTVVNQGPESFAEYVQVVAVPPNGVKCEGYPEWKRALSVDGKEHGFFIGGFSLISGSPYVLPKLVFKNVPLLNNDSNRPVGIFKIWARCRDAPAQGIQFWLGFVTNSTQRAPFILKSNPMPLAEHQL